MKKKLDGYKRIRRLLKAHGIQRAISHDCEYDGVPTVCLMWNGRREYVSESLFDFHPFLKNERLEWLVMNYADVNLPETKRVRVSRRKMRRVQYESHKRCV